jgi:D-glycero-alpha-D-manno-heptose 1-phosphate guanylyltransferase
MTSITDLSIAILAGGLGTRLRSEVSHVPKAMAPILGTPFLNYLLDGLIEQGARHVILCIGYGGDQIRDYYCDRYGSLNLTYSLETHPLGTAGALRHCISHLKSNEFLVINGDTYCGVDLNHYLAWYRQRLLKASIVLVHKADVSRYGSVTIDSDEHITAFHEKTAQSGGGYVSAGIYLLHRDIVKSIPKDREVSIEYEVLPKWIGQGLSGYKTNSTFIDIGTPTSYRMAQEFFSGKHFSKTKREGNHPIQCSA